MKLKRFLFVLGGSIVFGSLLLAAVPPKAAPPANTSNKAEQMTVEGEKRFRANCGRCHQAPHKLSPAMMRTAIRHMRVRATLTDEDMRYILEYMTQ